MSLLSYSVSLCSVILPLYKHNSFDYKHFTVSYTLIMTITGWVARATEVLFLAQISSETTLNRPIFLGFKTPYDNRYKIEQQFIDNL